MPYFIVFDGSVIQHVLSLAAEKHVHVKQMKNEPHSL
jgi:hypothetical protein